MVFAHFFNKLTLALSKARYVKQYYKKGFLTQLTDLIVLFRLNPTCGFFDYYQYQLYAVARGSSLYSSLLGDGSLEAFSRSLNPRNAVTPAWDKMLFAVLCNAYKIRTTEILAIYKPTGRTPEFIQVQLTDLSQFREFLINEKKPIFVKPVKGALGHGAFVVSGIDEQGEYVVNKNGDSLSFADFIGKTIGLTGSHRYKPSAGVLLQRVVNQHPKISAFTQTDTPSGLRILVLNTGEGPFIHRAVWKIVTQGNISDNFSKGMYGNMLCQIDLETGRVSSAVNKYWPEGQLLEQHPISGQNFSEFTLPLWQQVKAEVLTASSVFNDMGALHWDVIITEKGAVFLELNDIGGTNILQLHRIGLVDPELKKKLKQKGGLPKESALARFINK